MSQVKISPEQAPLFGEDFQPTLYNNASNILPDFRNNDTAIIARDAVYIRMSENGVDSRVIQDYRDLRTQLAAAQTGKFTCSRCTMLDSSVGITSILDTPIPVASPGPKKISKRAEHNTPSKARTSKPEIPLFDSIPLSTIPKGSSVDLALRAKLLLAAIEDLSVASSRKGFVEAVNSEQYRTSFLEKYGDDLNNITSGAKSKIYKRTLSAMDNFLNANGYDFEGNSRVLQGSEWRDFMSKIVGSSNASRRKALRKTYNRQLTQRHIQDHDKIKAA